MPQRQRRNIRRIASPRTPLGHTILTRRRIAHGRTQRRGQLPRAHHRPLSTARISTSHSLGLSASWELDLWGRVSAGVSAAQASAQASADDLAAARLSLQAAVAQVHTAEPVLEYLQDLVAATRSGRWFLQGLSPRAALAVVRAAKAEAFLQGRDYVAPDDIAAVLPQTTAHRLVPVRDAGRGAVEQVRAMLDAVPLP